MNNTQYCIVDFVPDVTVYNSNNDNIYNEYKNILTSTFKNTQCTIIGYVYNDYFVVRLALLLSISNTLSDLEKNCYKEYINSIMEKTEIGCTNANFYFNTEIWNTNTSNGNIIYNDSFKGNPFAMIRNEQNVDAVDTTQEKEKRKTNNPRYWYMRRCRGYYSESIIQKIRNAERALGLIMWEEICDLAIENKGIIKYTRYEDNIDEEIYKEINENNKKKFEKVMEFLKKNQYLEQQSNGDYYIPYVASRIGTTTASTERSKKSRAKAKERETD